MKIFSIITHITTTELILEKNMLQINFSTIIDNSTLIINLSDIDISIGGLSKAKNDIILAESNFRKEQLQEIILDSTSCKYGPTEGLLRYIDFIMDVLQNPQTTYLTNYNQKYNFVFDYALKEDLLRLLNYLQYEQYALAYNEMLIITKNLEPYTNININDVQENISTTLKSCKTDIMIIQNLLSQFDSIKLSSRRIFANYKFGLNLAMEYIISQLQVSQNINPPKSPTVDMLKLTNSINLLLTSKTNYQHFYFNSTPLNKEVLVELNYIQFELLKLYPIPKKNIQLTEETSLPQIKDVLKTLLHKLLNGYDYDSILSCFYQLQTYHLILDKYLSSI